MNRILALLLALLIAVVLTSPAMGADCCVCAATCAGSSYGPGDAVRGALVMIACGIEKGAQSVPALLAESGHAASDGLAQARHAASNALCTVEDTCQKITAGVFSQSARLSRSACCSFLALISDLLRF